MLDLDEQIFPALLKELRLDVVIWTPSNLTWCKPDGGDPSLATFHLQLDHGTIKRVRPRLDAHRSLQDVVRHAMALATAARGEVPNGCVPHGPLRAPAKLSLRNWWHHRLLQHTPDLLAEMKGTSIILYYKDVAIILSQASVKALHRTFATHVGISKFDLASEVDAFIAFRKSTH
jgi:hypothetical protein